MDAYGLITQWRKKADRVEGIPREGKDRGMHTENDSLAACLRNCADDLEKLLKDAPVRVLRIIEYAGDRHSVEAQVSNSLHGVKYPHNGLTIRAATIGTFPEILIGEGTKEEKQS